MRIEARSFGDKSSTQQDGESLSIILSSKEDTDSIANATVDEQGPVITWIYFRCWKWC